jgi:hypothetical protein
LSESFLNKSLNYADWIKRDFNLVAFKTDNICWFFAYKQKIITIMFYQTPNRSIFTVFESNFGLKGREIFESNHYDSFKRFLNSL